jgi:hypothetical protein
MTIAVDPKVFDTELFLPGSYVSVTLTARSQSPLVLPPAGHGEITGGGWFGPEDALPDDVYPVHRTLVEAANRVA